METNYRNINETKKETKKMLRTKGTNPSRWIGKMVLGGVVLGAAVLAGCTSPLIEGGAPGVVTAGRQQILGRTYTGNTIVNLQPAKIKDVNPNGGYGYGYAISGLGAAIGGVAASTLVHSNNYHVNNLARLLGVAAGVIGARKIQQVINTKPGCIITVKTKSGKTPVIAQQAYNYCVSYHIGEHVNIIQFNNNVRIVPSTIQ